MTPIDFDGSNFLLNKPPEMTADECEPLNVLALKPQGGGHTMIISCWKLSREELEQINRTGVVWLVVYGEAMPPVGITTERPFHFLNGEQN